MDAFLGLHGGQVRVTLRHLGGQRGVGALPLNLRLELISMSPTLSLDGIRMLLSGQLYVGPEAGGMEYLSQIATTAPISLHSPATQVDVTSEITQEEIEAIDKLRGDGGVQLTLNVHGFTFIPDDPLPQPFTGQLIYRVDPADWGRVLEECGYGKRVIAHIPNEAPPSTGRGSQS